MFSARSINESKYIISLTVCVGLLEFLFRLGTVSLTRRWQQQQQRQRRRGDSGSGRSAKLQNDRTEPNRRHLLFLGPAMATLVMCSLLLLLFYGFGLWHAIRIEIIIYPKTFLNDNLLGRIVNSNTEPGNGKRTLQKLKPNWNAALACRHISHGNAINNNNKATMNSDVLFNLCDSSWRIIAYRNKADFLRSIEF